MNAPRTVKNSAVFLAAILCLFLAPAPAHAGKMADNPLALSACTAVAPLLSNLAPGTAKALTATCNNAPAAAGYAWKIRKGATAAPTALACTGKTCTVPGASLAVEGTYIVTVTNNNASGTGTVAGSAAINVSATPKSDCTALTPPLSNLAPGTAKSLTATCNNAPAAAGYVWKIRKGAAAPITLACTGKTCTVPGASLATAGTYTVTVTNNNASGAGIVAGSATLVVSATPKSDCTAVSPPLSNLAPGTAKALAATCNNAPAAAGYVWKIRKGAAAPITLACTGKTCTVPGASLATAGTYTVTVTNNNASGAGVVAGSATLAVSATPKSDCTAITPPLSNLAPGAAKALVATCNNAPAAAGYVWKVQKVGVAIPATLACTGKTCTVPGASLATAGTYTVTVTNNNAGGAGNVAGRATLAVSATPKSDCTAVTPPLSNLAPGTAKALVATCNNNPAATGYVWKIRKGAAAPTALACTGKTCTVPGASLAAAGTYTVTATNNNAGGAGNVAGRATLAVSATPKSDCTAIAPALSAITPGSNSPQLAATCNNAPAAAGYVWKVQKTGAAAPTALACTGKNCTVPAARLATAGNYTVTATNNNAGGAGNVAGRATVSVLAQPLSACTAIAPPAPGVTLGASSPLLTATCNNGPTSYVWKVQKTGAAAPTALGCTGATCTVPAANLSAAGTYNVTVRANNAAGAGTQAAGATITVAAPAAASTFNDTGITANQCYQTGGNTLVACNSAGALALNNAQDGMKGRDADAATNGGGDGKLGFSFSTVAGGCVLDNVTGLMWEVKTTDGGLRDWNKTYTNYSAAFNPVGQYGAATDAAGFAAAVNAVGLCGHHDWRLPAADELQGIVDYGMASPGPTIDATWFPNTKNSYFWSSSPEANAPGSGWYVYFFSSSVGRQLRRGSSHVRLVRAGQPPTVPRYTISADGHEVTDNRTKLIWKRCVEGMSWDGATCAGVAGTFTHEAALQRAAAQAASTGVAWRLPDVKELGSTADRSRKNPAIDPTAFPATPSDTFWSSSPHVGYSGIAWYVDFYNGNVSYDSYDRSFSFHARLVRAGQ